MRKSRVILKIEENASVLPNKTALSFEETKYTFHDLLVKIKRLASAIDSQYTGKPILVFANREAETLLFFLAVVISGNFYVPIDPEMPTEKIKAIVEEVEPAGFFGNEKNESVMAALGSGYKLLTIASSGPYKHEAEITDDFPLYMVYTSGSTGKPKGVLKTHKAMASFMETFASAFPFEDETIGNQTPFYFDASAKDIYLMLESGSTLEIIPSELFIMPPRLISYLNQKKITFISWVPTALSLIANMKAFQYAAPQYLKKVFFVGEIMPVKSLNYWIEALPDVRFTNLYGQSEIAGVACCFPVNGVYDETKLLPIGRPLNNCKVFLQDEEKTITQPGTVGEIVIVSEALAAGYYKDASNPAFEILNGERAFHTGDYAYYDEAGNMVFAARKDAQIKHLGRRIELGEIEAAAGSIDGVERCCCLYDEPNKKIVLFCQTALDAAKIKELLRTKISKYMLPEKVIVMDHIPINANGKTDRQYLKGMM